MNFELWTLTFALWSFTKLIALGCWNWWQRQIHCKLAHKYTGSYPGAVHSRWCLRPPPTGPVWLRICWEPHLQVTRTLEVLWEAARPHCAWWHPGHHFTVHLAGAIHSQGTQPILALWLSYTLFIRSAYLTCIAFYSLIPRLKEKCFSCGLHGIKAKGSIAANVYL